VLPQSRKSFPTTDWQDLSILGYLALKDSLIPKFPHALSPRPEALHYDNLPVVLDSNNDIMFID
jgi:hypothetical protein